MSQTWPRLKPIVGLAPWTDRRGRLHPLRAAAFTLLMLPAAWLALRWALDLLGARPVTAAIHATGYWAAWIFVASLVISPAKALLGMPNIVVVRRIVGVAAACYAGVHLTLYMVDQNWRLSVIATEIAVRAYLTIGFVTLLGLVALGVTSTDGWVKRLGRNWKRLHKLAYGFAILALIHFFLQSKADVSQATLAAGVFAWAMTWRVLPVGRDRGPLPLLGMAFVAGTMALLFEWAWYRFGTHIDPLRVLRGEFDVDYGLHPAGLVLLLGLLVAGLIELRNLAQTRFGAGPGYVMLVYSLGALAGGCASLVMGWPLDDVVPEGSSALVLTLTAIPLYAMLSLARHRLRDVWQRRLVDALWLVTLLTPVLAEATESRSVGLAGDAIVVTGALLLATCLWTVSRRTSALALPLAALIAYQALALL